MLFLEGEGEVKRLKKPSRESASATSSSSSGAPTPPAMDPAGVVRKDGERSAVEAVGVGVGTGPVPRHWTCAAAAVQDLELRIAEDERGAGPHSLEWSRCRSPLRTGAEEHRRARLCPPGIAAIRHTLLPVQLAPTPSTAEA